MIILIHLSFCIVADSTEGIFTDVLVRGPTVAPSAAREGNSASLHCSVLSTPPEKSCSAQYSFYWFRAKDDQSLPSVLYVSGEEHSECDSQRCVYHFSKNISSDDMGTYYCALAACGEILFGHGTKLEGTHGFSRFDFFSSLFEKCTH